MKDLEIIRAEISDSFDKYLAVLGAVTSIFMIPVLILLGQNLIQAGLVIYFLFACGIYLLLRPRWATRRELALPKSQTTRECLITNIAFFAVLTYAVLSIGLRSQPYSRPLGYFLAIGAMASLLAFESMRLPAKRGYQYVVLAKIMLLGILLRWVPQMIFPGGFYFDSWYHEYVAEATLSTFHIVEMGALSYSRLPVMHLQLASTMLVTGLDFETAFMLLISPLQVIVQTIFTYLLAVRFITGKRIALLAALLVTIADVVMAQGSLAYPTTLAVMLLIAIVYVIFRARQSSSPILLALCLVLMVTLILTHTLVSFAMAMILLCFWLGYEVYSRIHRLPVGLPPAAFSLVALFVVAMLSWWMYASGHIWLVARALRWGLREDYFTMPAPEQAIAYSAEIPATEILLDRAGFSLYYAFAALGCLYLTSKASIGGVRGFVLALGGILFAAFAFLGPLLSLFILPARWYLLSQVALAIPAALGMILVVDVAGRGKTVLLGTVVGLVAFSMVADVAANFDTPIFSPARLVRRAFTESELQSMDTITDLWDGIVSSDLHANSYLTYGRLVPTLEISEALGEKDFLPLEGTAILIRESIASNPFNARATWKLGYDPRDLLASQGFARLYDSGSASLFYK